MNRPTLRIAAGLALAAACACFPSCAGDDAPPVSVDAKRIYADQQYYPTLDGCTWRYRIDTTGETGGTVRDAMRRTMRITGTQVIDSLTYTVQSIETDAGITTTFDTLYIRKTPQGIYASSPALQRFSLIPGLPLNLGFPKEILLLPNPLESAQSWSILDFEFNQIPLFPIYFRVSATYAGLETVTTDYLTFKQCARVKIDISARLPNLQNPQDLLNPTVINETASFWFARPLGLVVGDGSDVVFAFLAGGIPFTSSRKRIHQEVLGFDIVQPPDPCGGN